MATLYRPSDGKPERSGGTQNIVTAEVDELHLRPSHHDLAIGLASHPGRVRDQNEDACFAWQFVLAQEGHDPLSLGLFAVADGMGGHSQGAQASAVACRLAAGHIFRQICLPLLSDDELQAERAPINDVLESSVRIAHEAVARRLPNAGTTLSLALVLGDGAYMAHVGDSRIYMGKRGHLRAVTRDHSMAARLVEMGQPRTEEVTAQRNVLYRAVGQGPAIEPDVLYRDLPWGSYILICCDGLWNHVSEGEIATLVEAAATPDLACQKLVALANDHGGEDNISVILVARGWPLPEQATEPGA